MAIEYIEIIGTCFTCQVRYRTRAALDRIAAFFYEQVLPHEHRIEVLVSSFGLPRRVMEDILAELLLRNFAILDVVRKEIRPLKNPRTSCKRVIGRRQIEIWQDNLTGAFVPVSAISDRTQRPKGGNILSTFIIKPSDKDRGVDFLSVPDTRIISDLNVVDPMCLAHDPTEAKYWQGLINHPIHDEGETEDDSVWDPTVWIVDALVEKSWSRSLPIYVRVSESQVVCDGGTKSVQFVDEPDLPWRLTRDWSVRLSEVSDQTTAIVALAQANESVNERGILWQHVQRNTIDIWAELLEERLSFSSNNAAQKFAQIENRETQARSRMIDDLNGALIRQVSLHKPQSGETHIQEMWAETRSYLAIVIDNTTVDLVDKALSGLEDFGSRGAWFIVLQSGIDQSQILNQRPRILHDHLLNPFHPTLCIRDGEEVRFGDLNAILSTNDLIRIIDPTIVQHLADQIAAPTSSRRVAEIIRIRPQTEVGRTFQLKEQADQIRRQERYQTQMNRLNKYFQALDGRILELKNLLIKDRIGDQNEHKLATDTSGIDAIRSLYEIEREVEETLDADEECPHRLADYKQDILTLIDQYMIPHAHWTTEISSHEMIDCLLDALHICTYSGQQHKLRIVMTQLPEFFSTPEYFARFREAIDAGTQIQLFCRTEQGGETISDERISIVKQFCSQLGSRGVTFHFAESCGPDLIGIDIGGSDLLVIGSFLSGAEVAPIAIAAQDFNVTVWKSLMSDED